MAASLLAWSMLALTPAAIHAADVRQGDTIIVPAGEMIDDDLYVFGQSVTIQGTVNGDVIAGGQSVTIQGTVNGDVFVAAQSVNVSGPVSGDLMAAGTSVVVTGPVGGAARLASQTIEINAPVGHDLLAGAATINVGPQAAIGQDLLVGGSAVTIGGAVARSLRAGAESLTIGSPVGGDVTAQVGTLRLVSGAHIQGNLSYTSSQEAVVDPDATVRGSISRMEAEAAPVEPNPAAQFGARVLDWFRTLVGLSVFGLALVLLFPVFSRRAADTLVDAPWASLGLGFALLVGVPVAAVLLFGVGLLVGGWWLGPLVLALYFGLLPIGFAIVSLFLGRTIMQRVGRPDVARGWSLLAGLVLLGLVNLVPFAGGVALFAAMLFGLGATILTLKGTYQGRPAATDAVVLPLNHSGAPLVAPTPAR